METLRRLKKAVSDKDFPDAVSIAAEALNKIKVEFQQEFELDIVKLQDVESYINSKILIRVTGGKHEFEFFKKLD
jgi:hypothetical protein